MEKNPYINDATTRGAAENVQLISRNDRPYSSRGTNAKTRT